MQCKLFFSLPVCWWIINIHDGIHVLECSLALQTNQTRLQKFKSNHILGPKQHAERKIMLAGPWCMTHAHRSKCTHSGYNKHCTSQSCLHTNPYKSQKHPKCFSAVSSRTSDGVDGRDTCMAPAAPSTSCISGALNEYTKKLPSAPVVSKNRPL